MEELRKMAQSFKEQSLLNVQELSIGKDMIPIASCSEQGNPYVLSRCKSQKIYDNKSNVITSEEVGQDANREIEAYEVSLR